MGKKQKCLPEDYDLQLVRSMASYVDATFVKEYETINGNEALVRLLLRMVGEDPAREGLKETPRRFIEAMKFYCSGYGKKPADVLKVFKDGAEHYDQMVVQLNIPVHSLCEHHLAPFFGIAHIGYLPNKSVVGLSKLSRLVDVFARRLQVQERLTNQIGAALWDHLKPLGVGVVLECRHMCMECRGVQKENVPTITSALYGRIKTKPAARAEFLALVHAK